jgi:hypothetical protein
LGKGGWSRGKVCSKSCGDSDYEEHELFLFVSPLAAIFDEGHGFSRATRKRKDIRLQPLGNVFPVKARCGLRQKTFPSG